MSTQKDGKRILVKLGSATYAGQTDTSISLNTDVIDVTSKSSTGGFKEFLAGEQGATISFTGLQAIDGATDVDDLVDDYLAKTVGTFVWGAAGSGALTLTGQAFISQLTLTGAKNTGEGYSGTLQITGEITKAIVE
jgi:predicted secreted protein